MLSSTVAPPLGQGATWTWTIMLIKCLSSVCIDPPCSSQRPEAAVPELRHFKGCPGQHKHTVEMK